VRTRRSEGSSPLARGLPQAVRRERADRGIIPARAGFTHPLLCARRKGPDHPRSRGVYVLAAQAAKFLGGSSPLARGLRRRLLLSGRDQRIIPARAGFTLLRIPRQQERQDHPRSRGVYRNLEKRNTSSPGSSPLARGLLEMWQCINGEWRIIPARAGFTR